MDLTSHDLEETAEIAGKLLATLSRGEQAVVIGLSGDLGSGKTALSQAIAKHLGVVEHVTSPTFVIRKSYNLENQIWKQLIHIDAYRLKSSAELITLDFKKDLENPDNLIIVEWAEIVKDILPENLTYIRCRFIDPNTRQFVW